MQAGSFCRKEQRRVVNGNFSAGRGFLQVWANSKANKAKALSDHKNPSRAA